MDKKGIILCSVLCLAAACAGADWGPEMNLTEWSVGGSWTTSNNAKGVACSGDTVFLVWHDSRMGPAPNRGYRIFCRVFDGQIWSGEMLVGAFNNSAFHNWNPSCAADEYGRLHVVWESNDINYPDQGNDDIAYRMLQGNTWTSAVRLTNHPLHSWYPSISCGPGGRLDVFWQDDRDGGFRIYARTFDGAAWQPEYCLDTLCRAAAFPSAAASQGRPAVAWQEFRTGMNQIFFRAQGPGGWGADSAVSHSTSGAFTPCLVSDAAGDLHLAWEDYRDGNGEIYYRRLSAATGSWDPEARLTFDPSHSRAPVMACRGDSLVDLFWADDRDGNYEIYAATSINGAWGAESRLTYQSASSLCPSAAADSRGNLHLAWTDTRVNQGYSPDIFFMSNINNPWPKSGMPPEAGVGIISGFTAVPNPAFGRVRFSCNLNKRPSDGLAELAVYNLSGQRLARIQKQNANIGENLIEWDGMTDDGRRPASGVYLARVTAGGQSASRKLVVLQ
jgi:hypothetical protein